MEYYLHYIWQNNLFDSLEGSRELASSQIDVLDIGIINEDAGADFLNAKIKIDGILWVGNIEIHTRSSQWKEHHHDEDPTYNNVILHIVKEDNQQCISQNGRIIPTAVIKYSETVYQKAVEFYKQRDYLVCKKYLKEIELSNIEQWIDSLWEKRIRYKEAYILDLLNKTNNDWDEVLYRLLMRYMGFNLNNESMEQVAMTIPYKILQKHRDNLLQVQAFLLGQANLLNAKGLDATLSKKLFEEYSFLKKMYGLTPIDKGLFRFLRIRPNAFPTIKLLQLSMIIHRIELFRQKIINTNNIKDIVKLFTFDINDLNDIPPNYVAMSKESIHNIIINIVLPYRYTYAKMYNKKDLKNSSLMLFRQLKFENNRVTRLFPKDIFTQQTAQHSQALLHLYSNYCQKKRCLFCHWGRCLSDKLFCGR